MNIYSAIDLKNGKCVRLKQGDPNKETIYSESPVETAKRWTTIGTDWLHIVNLDGAFGNPDQAAKNVEAVQAILQSVTVPIEFGGGLRGLADVEQALTLGISRVVIGSLAVGQPQIMVDMLKRFGGERVALGLDVKDGQVATSGWQKLATTDALELVRLFQPAGLKYIIHTDISRDGMLSGVNLAASIALAQAGQGSYKVIVSGGVADLEDVRRVKAAENEGLEGLIIGKALYAGALDLADAMRLAHDKN